MINRFEPWGIYIHVPWCHRRCSYCDFYFEIGRAHADFADKICEEWDARHAQWPADKAVSLYFGGGTPSVLPTAQLGQIISHIKKSALLRSDAEITLEANPEDLTEDSVKALSQMGVNRLSLGIQSFDDEVLRLLGRKHRSDKARQIVELCVASGFSSISVDLIVGVPNENIQNIISHASWLKNSGIGHLSVYLLTIEEGTFLERQISSGIRPGPDEDAQADAYMAMQAALTGLGYAQYEISSYALPGQESRHNRLYWAQGSYLGLGPGAHSMTLLPDGSVKRRHTVARLPEWIKKPLDADHSEEILSRNQALRESMAFGIRDLQRGIGFKRLADRHQIDLPADFEPTVEGLVQKGWVVRDAGCLRLTALGARFADAVSREFLALS